MHDYYNVKRAAGIDESCDPEPCVIARIGSELREKYDDIFPLLVLLEYRWFAEAGPFENYLLRVFQFDTLMGRKRVKVLFGKLLAPVLWGWSRLKYLGKEQQDKIVFSNTFLKSRRYPSTYKSIEEKYGCIALLTLWDTLESVAGDTLSALRKSIRCNWGIKSPIFIPSATLAGKKLQRSVLNYCSYVYRDGGKDPQVLESLLFQLRMAYRQRKSWLIKRLKEQSIRCYITVNQYNLRDLLMIDVCDELGAQTVQHEHHAAQFDAIHPMKRIAFAQGYSVFDSGEWNFHRLVFSYDNILHPNKEVRFYIGGNTELTYSDALQAAKKYPVRRKITYMVSPLQDDDFGTAEQIQAANQRRMDIFEQLHLLKERTGAEVTVRYKPYEELEQRKIEAPILKGWGIHVSDSLPENLMEDMCTACIIMSTGSTVLSTAISLGKRVYRVEDPGVSYLKVNPDIIDITVGEISQIDVPEIAADRPILPENFFDIDRIIRYAED